MQEIFKEDFDDKFQNIHTDFQNAAFFAIDNEFSGLMLGEKLSQFDSMDKRYMEYVKDMKDYVSLQIGITAFHYSKESNTYESSTYCFYLFPQSFGNADAGFFCLTSAFEFLREYDFDFNKLVYHGIPYLSHQEEKELTKALNTGEILNNLSELLNLQERNKIQNICSELSQRLAIMKMSNSKKKGSLTNGPINEESNNNLDFKIEAAPLLAYALYHEIHQRFPEICIHPENYGMRLEWEPIAEKSTMDYSVIDDIFKKRIVRSLQGFTRVFDLLIDLKKPIVGHNMFSDLQMMLKQFHGPLPGTLQEFKKEVHRLFPAVYDTKFFCQELKKRYKTYFRKEKTWKTSTLEGLYNYFQDGFEGLSFKIHHPLILQSIDSSAAVTFHNAGWDSYCTGFIFLRMIHLAAVLSEDMIYEGKVPTMKDYMSFAKPFSNRVNIIRGEIGYIILDDDDPSSNRPTQLFVRSRNNTELDFIQVAKLCSCYGTIDIKQLNKFTALISISSKAGCRRILRNFKSHPSFTIERYSAVRHNPAVRFSLWTTFTLVTGASVFLLIKTFPQLKK